MYVSSRKGFTLIELLVVIAIIAILAVVVVLTLNPAELLRQTRDSNRLSDMSTLVHAIGIYQEDLSAGSMGSPSTTYLSIPDANASTTAGDACQALGMSVSTTWHCASSTYYRQVNGTGWLPINFASTSVGSPLGSLPIDPTNNSSSNLFYTYQTNGNQYEITSAMESQKYQSIEANDGGTYSDLFEQGTNLALAAMDFGGGSGSSATGTVSQASMRLSTINGTAFVDFSSAGTLTPYIGDKLTITDYTGHQLIGYIKAAGTGETYGSSQGSDPGMEGAYSSGLNSSNGLINGTPLQYTAGPHGGLSAQQINNAAGNTGKVYQSVFTQTAGKLFQVSMWIKALAGSGYMYPSFSGTTCLGSPDTSSSTWTQFTTYCTVGTTGGNTVTMVADSNAVANTNQMVFDDMLVRQVNTPSATGVTITTTSNGSTQNWASIDSGFNVNDASGYSYSIVP
jgi:prepilin-type N-terminal cleavage/methylation domain-containing protein